MKRTVTRIQVFLLTSIGIVLLISVLAPYLVPYDAYDTNPDAILQAPSATLASAISGPMEWSEKPTTALGKALRSSLTPRKLTISGGLG